MEPGRFATAVINGAREGRPGGLRRLLARALAFRPAVFVLPGLDIARARGLDLESAGLRVVATPRHAELLLIVGELPEALAKAAVVVYAQMVRPRAIVALDAGDISPLPPAHVVGAVGQEALQTAVQRARELLRTAAWAEDVQPFEGEGLVVKRRQPKPAPQPAVEAPAQGAPAGHAENTSSMTADTMEGMRHGGPPPSPVEAMAGMQHGSMMGPAASGGSSDAHTAMAHVDSAQTHNPTAGQPHAMAGHDMSGMAHGGMQMTQGGSPEVDKPKADQASTMAGHDMAGMGFMSMVRLTQNQPRSADGLPMEWVQTPLGPFFASLPSGLDLTVWLDGDEVARVKVGAGLTSRGVEQSLLGDAAGLPDRLARLDPLAPAAYHVLAICALESASGEGGTIPARIAMLERERVASHLNWLAAFGNLLGYAWMEQHATRLHRALVGAAGAREAAALQPAIERFLSRVRRAPLIEHRLRGIGMVPVAADDSARGPVARGGGVARDARSADRWYTELGFEPVVAEGGDALARVRVRMEEISRSLRLLGAVADAGRPLGEAAAAAAPVTSGSGEATVETPRGAATLAILVEDGMVREVRLDTPTTAHLKLIDQVVLHQELADALVGVASLDLAPWEASR